MQLGGLQSIKSHLRTLSVKQIIKETGKQPFNDFLNVSIYQNYTKLFVSFSISISQLKTNLLKTCWLFCKSLLIHFVFCTFDIEGVATFPTLRLYANTSHCKQANLGLFLHVSYCRGHLLSKISSTWQFRGYYLSLYPKTYEACIGKVYKFVKIVILKP